MQLTRSPLLYKINAHFTSIRRIKASMYKLKKKKMVFSLSSFFILDLQLFILREESKLHQMWTSHRGSSIEWPSLFVEGFSQRGDSTLIYRESLCRAYAESCFGTVTSFVSSSFSLDNRKSSERSWWSAWRSLPVNQDSPSFYLPARVLFTRVNVPIILPFFAAHILHLEKCDKFVVLSWYSENTVLKSIYIISTFLSSNLYPKNKIKY